MLLGGSFAAAALVFTLSAPAFGQGNSQGKGKGAGKGNSVRTEKGDADRGYDNRYDDKDRGKPGKNKRKGATSPRFNGLAKKIGMSPERAQDWYERDRYLNPDLTFGQFVAANMIARKQGSRYPRVTAEAIFRRMRDGASLGQAVKDLGMRGKDYDDERRRIDDVFGDYEKERIRDRDRVRYGDRKTIGEIVDDYVYRIGW